MWTRGFSERSSLTHRDLHVVRSLDRSLPANKLLKFKKMHLISGVTKDAQLGVFEASIDNLERALLERMYYTKMADGTFEPPLVPKNSVIESLTPFIQSVARFTGKLQPLSIDEVVASYTGGKRKRYELAAKIFRTTGYLAKYAYITMFVKCEKSNLAKPPRGIQPRHPVYNLCLARYLKNAEKKIYHAIGKVFGNGKFTPTIMKHYNALQVGNIIARKWKKFSNPVGLGADATKFDMHVSAPMLAKEHELYKTIYQDKFLTKLLRGQLKTTGYASTADGSLKYTVNGCRCSGDLNTSLGNCVIMCAMMYTWSKLCGVSIELINNGDDCMIFMESCDLKRFTDGADNFFRDMGFRMVFEKPVYELPQVEFCQSRPIRVAGGTLMVRNIPTVLGKDMMTTLDLSNRKTFREWCYAVGDCGLSMYGAVPVLRDFYNMFAKCGKEVNYRESREFLTSGRQFSSRGMRYKYTSEVEAETIYDIWVAWGITPAQQGILEAHFRRTDLLEFKERGEVPRERTNTVELPY